MEKKKKKKEVRKTIKKVKGMEKIQLYLRRMSAEINKITVYCLVFPVSLLPMTIKRLYFTSPKGTQFNFVDFMSKYSEMKNIKCENLRISHWNRPASIAE